MQGDNNAENLDALAERVRGGESLKEGTDFGRDFIRCLLADSHSNKASHIHFHRAHGELVVRYRIDGGLVQRTSVPLDAVNGFFPMLKSYFRLDMSETRRPQDGSIRISIAGQKVEIRASMMPTAGEYSAVLAWQLPDTSCCDLRGIGLLDGQRTKVERMLQNDRGLIVSTGYSWHGATALAHAALLSEQCQGRKAISLEQRVEGSLPGVIQCDMQSASKLSPLEWFQNVLRQQPDVIFIEYPDRCDTIKHVINAAATQCLVIAAITKPVEYLVEYLEHLNVPRATTVSVLLGVIGQTPITRLCPHCAEQYTPKQSELRALKIRCPNPDQLVFAKNRGCDACHGMDRRSLTWLHEVVPMSSELQNLFLSDGDVAPIRPILLNTGMSTFYQSAVHKLVMREVTATSVMNYQSPAREPIDWVDVDPVTGLCG